MSHWEGMFFDRETQNYLLGFSESEKKNPSCDFNIMKKKSIGNVNICM